MQQYQDHLICETISEIIPNAKHYGSKQIHRASEMYEINSFKSLSNVQHDCKI